MSQPPDQVIEAQVDVAISDGYPLPRWGWPTPRTYNGATGEERVRGWQKVQIGKRLGLLTLSPTCDVCASQSAQGSHTCIYFRPMTTKPVCKSCHFAIHRRFSDPDKWLERLAHLPAARWVHAIPLVELTRTEALEIAKAFDVFDALAVRRNRGPVVT